MPVYTEAQCCFKSLALRSCQCGRKTRYGLEFWSLDLPSARVNFLGRVPALMPSAHSLSTTLRYHLVDNKKVSRSGYGHGCQLIASKARKGCRPFVMLTVMQCMMSPRNPYIDQESRCDPKCEPLPLLNVV